MNNTYSKDQLTTQELLVFNSELKNRQKSPELGYLLLVAGAIGLHRFYIGKVGTAILQIILSVIAVISYISFLIYLELDVFSITSLLFLIPTALALLIWLVVDIFVVNKHIKAHNEQVQQQLLEEIIINRSVN